ncbi:PH domain containing protein kinase, putative [Entamoeba histolytica HM-1:IMSS-B]|uniref:PH-protein kinase domain containing protein n=6 Tax=Entamoeba histolytica TaxID=5759 RepID=C4LVW8_ENTH1|nr:PH-protein kinase domain containing protein [Entamoeba histolytica HM-1:IMSS]EMD44693.1 PH-protein kinase domain containing protein [Entamoeba histolytica KU27]EMH76945.1 PH domain containing protein kinase, putative [Entamoeba histolytica HM-1:IMSS-B]EMS14293.1 PH-protein kinase domain containing protein [Entamoeba histolytica HM-3:IMSS]ENY61172.1 PH-protein kinase domain containing protein [Entamoeba histolytica HM-1:IMSS-A]GAT92826.1 ph domain containing protein kinase putative [Entamoeb|eukprot:XP_656496.1 PH-protein kinase domain containing protein [Entamoeba histolytica HM-1:IMSS]
MPKEGWLAKQGGGWKNWKHRWFVLDGTTLTYYKDQLRMKKMGEIDLMLAFAIVPNEELKLKNFPYIFSISTPSRVYNISASSSKERDEWIESLLNSKNKKETLIEKEEEEKPISIEDFDIITLLGKGAFGKVLLVRYKRTGEKFALKMVEKKKVIEMEELEHTMTEKNILQKVKHPFLVNLYYSFQSATHLHYVIDYCPGGELYYRLIQEKSFCESRTQFYISQVILALECLHQMNIIYRDVKLENVLICEDGYLRLTDFGLSKENVSGNETTATFCGTPEYLSPEVVLAEPYTNVIDWWGVGIMTYEMMHGQAPFISDNIQQLYQKILYSPVIFPTTSPVSAVCKDFITKMLEKKICDRLSTPEKIKTHPWWNSFDWDALYQKKIPAPFKPDMSQDGKTNFGEEFINEKFDLNEEINNSTSNGIRQDIFGEFTFTRDEPK